MGSVTSRSKGSPASARGVVTAASAARYSGSRIRTFLRKMTGVVAAAGLVLACSRTCANLSCAAAGQDAAGSLAAHLGGLHDDDAVDGVLSLWGELEDGPLAAL